MQRRSSGIVPTENSSHRSEEKREMPDDRVQFETKLRIDLGRHEATSRSIVRCLDEREGEREEIVPRLRR